MLQGDLYLCDSACGSGNFQPPWQNHSASLTQQNHVWTLVFSSVMTTLFVNNKNASITLLGKKLLQRLPSAVSPPPPLASSTAAPQRPTSSQLFLPLRNTLLERLVNVEEFCQCSLVFSCSLRSIIDDASKISFVIGLLTGRALHWAETKFVNSQQLQGTFDSFVAEFKQTFGYTISNSDVTRRIFLAWNR